MVIVTPNTTTNVPLDELNQLIADQKGVTVDQLAIVPEGEKFQKPAQEPPAEYKSKWDKAREEKAAKADADKAPVVVEEKVEVTTKEVTPADLRSMADKLFKEAQALRRKADELDPPKKKATADKAEA